MFSLLKRKCLFIMVSDISLHCQRSPCLWPVVMHGVAKLLTSQKLGRRDTARRCEYSLRGRVPTGLLSSIRPNLLSFPNLPKRHHQIGTNISLWGMFHLPIIVFHLGPQKLLSVSQSKRSLYTSKVIPPPPFHSLNSYCSVQKLNPRLLSVHP